MLKVVKRDGRIMDFDIQKIINAVRKAFASVNSYMPDYLDMMIPSLFEEGDIIAIDIPNASINVKVSDEVLAARRASYIAPEPNVKSGWLARYAKLVSGADQGAIMK